MSLKFRFLLLGALLVGFWLRVYNLNHLPNGLFSDEAARGYDAYSIAHTGADMFGVFLPLFPRSLDDYTPALYTYLSVPFVGLLGLTPFATRLAAVWIGLFTIAVGYQAMRHVFGPRVGLIGAWLMALSPWYILLNRIGTEWSLLGLGPMLTIVTAWRGLERPRWLVAAGIIGGISLYGYAPVKAFLPLLLLMFALFHQQELRAHPRAAALGGLLFSLLALPIYAFSFTPAGMTRYNEIAYFSQLPLSQGIMQAVRNYLAYFDPAFLFYTDPTRPNIFYIQRLRDVGLLYWFELPLLLLGLGLLITRHGERRHYFWLTWLLIAPLGINMHIHSPKPALWLTATPTLHGLAALGAAWLWARRHGPLIRLILLLLGALAVINISMLGRDLLTQFPQYGPRSTDWGYGFEAGVRDLLHHGPAFDMQIVDRANPIEGIYVAFYGAYPPAQRHAEVAAWEEQAWQRVGAVNIGNLLGRVTHQPGCHLALTRPKKLAQLPYPTLPLRHYPLPDGSPAMVLSAIAAPAAPPQPAQVVFGDQILLMGYQPINEAQPGQALCVLLQWQSAGNLPADYTVFVHLIDEESGQLWAQHDGPPNGGRQPTSQWPAGAVINDLHVVRLPTDAPAGPYHLRVGLYHAATGTRLRTAHGDDFVMLNVN